jgi:sugar phosphate isomerase/epimerase
MTLLDPRVICSTITLRHLPLRDALASISAAGFAGIDLGALPGVCDHVPFVLDADAVSTVATEVRASGLAVRSVNADVGDLNSPLDATVDAERLTHLDRLLDLCAAIDAQALVLPNGAQDHDPVDDVERDLDRVAGRLSEYARRAHDRGVQLWVEAPHFFRLVYDLDRTALLLDRLPESIGVVCDTSHITASGSTPREFLARFGERTQHVHLRDAEPGYIHHSIGRGVIDFADLVDALAEIGYTGDLSLELETRDVANDDRAETAVQAAQFISSLLAAPHAAADTTN